MNIVTIERPGMFTTIQDRGRYGSQRLGVPVNGAMDEDAHRIANALVGNDDTAATLECTLTGPTLRFSSNAMIALCGADFHVLADGHTVPMNRAIVIRAGVALDIRERRSGARLYIAIRGGITTPLILGSRSTFVRGGFGGLEGRALRAGDRLPINRYPGNAPEQNVSTSNVSSRHVSTAEAAKHFRSRQNARAADILARGVSPLEKLLIQSGMPITVGREIDLEQPPANAALRVIRGPQWRAFDTASRRRLWQADFAVSNQSDRMGYRLSGPPLNLIQPLEMISEAVNIGTIQVPPDGNPIVLMADRQTAGGYPKAGYVVSADLHRLAQALPGDTLRFAPVSHRQAEQTYLRNEERINRIANLATTALT